MIAVRTDNVTCKFWTLAISLSSRTDWQNALICPSCQTGLFVPMLSEWARFSIANINGWVVGTDKWVPFQKYEYHQPLNVTKMHSGKAFFSPAANVGSNSWFTTTVWCETVSM